MSATERGGGIVVGRYIVFALVSLFRDIREDIVFFSFPFSAFPEISPKTLFHFQHFPEPRQNLVSVFLIIFCSFPVFSCFSCFYALFPLFFSVFSPVFLVFRWKMMFWIPSRFPFLAHFSPQIASVKKKNWSCPPLGGEVSKILTIADKRVEGEPDSPKHGWHKLWTVP